MADITKCTNSTCKLSKTCYRTLAPDGFWQSYAAFKSEKVDNKTVCEYYWKVKKDKSGKVVNY